MLTKNELTNAIFFLILTAWLGETVRATDFFPTFLAISLKEARKGFLQLMYVSGQLNRKISCL